MGTLETSAPARIEAHAEIASTPRSEIVEEPTAPRVTGSVAPPEPKTNPRSTHERLSSDSPFTVQVPRTLRPVSTANVPMPAPAETPREQPSVRASTPVAGEEVTTYVEPAPVVHSANSDVVNESTTTTTASDMPATPAQPKPPVANQRAEHQQLKPVHTESVVPNATPIPRVERVDGPTRSEPSPPSALPVHLPPVAANTARQEQPRVHIGSLEVLVNNHPRIPTVRPAAAPARSERLNLEKRYLDRFRLRH